jgi:hypothetical protein
MTEPPPPARYRDGFYVVPERLTPAQRAVQYDPGRTLLTLRCRECSSQPRGAKDVIGRITKGAGGELFVPDHLDHVTGLKGIETVALSGTEPIIASCRRHGRIPVARPAIRAALLARRRNLLV